MRKPGPKHLSMQACLGHGCWQQTRKHFSDDCDLVQSTIECSPLFDHTLWPTRYHHYFFCRKNSQTLS